MRTTAQVTARRANTWRVRSYGASYRYEVPLADGQTAVYRGRGSISGRAYGSRASGLRIIYAESAPHLSKIGGDFDYDWWDDFYRLLPFNIFGTIASGGGALLGILDYFSKRQEARRWLEELAQQNPFFYREYLEKQEKRKNRRRRLRWWLFHTFGGGGGELIGIYGYFYHIRKR